MKKKKLMLYSLIVCFLLIGIYVYTSIGNNPILKSSSKMEEASTLAMMYETSAGSGEYELNNSTTWPTEGYVFNAEMSKCENGSKLTYNETTKMVTVEANVSDKCYVYFDKTVPTITFMIVSEKYTAKKDMTWNDWINSEYNDGWSCISSLVVSVGRMKRISNVSCSDRIIEGQNYSLIDQSGGSN